MLAAFLFAGSFISTLLLVWFAEPVFRKFGLMKTNYAGRNIPCSVGILFIPVFTAGYISAYEFIKDGISPESTSILLAMIMMITGMAFVGFVDDVAGSGKERGFKGHLSALLKGKLSTGLFKAAAGLVISLGAAYMIGGGFWEIVLNGFLIALCANLYNLFDLRPGRAMKLFLPVVGLLVIANWRTEYIFASYLLSTAGIASALLFGDLREKFMIGDAGSNVLGGIIGLGLAIWASIWLKLVLLGLVLGLNILSEVVSFSRVIESVKVFRWIDDLGRKGLGQR